MTEGRRRLWMAGYAVATFLAFPHPLRFVGPDTVLDLGAVVAYAVPVCLVLGLRGLTPRRAAASAHADRDALLERLGGSEGDEGG